jgi:hypothetical protein
MQKSKLVWLGIIAAAAAASVYYHILVFHHLEQTSALFIGIPTLIAAICVLTAQPRTATGTAVKAVTLFLAISGVLLGEGFICILMAAPIFFLVAVLIGRLVDRRNNLNRVYSLVLLMIVLPFTTEGTRPWLSFAREEVVTAERTIPASARQVEATLSSAPRLDDAFPLYLRLGFPRPVRTALSGTSPGDRYLIHFAGGEGKPGDLQLEVIQHQPGLLTFRRLSDTSHVAHWLAWQESQVEWKELDNSHTRVRWTLRYRRLLDPAWYFRPWERYAVRLTAEQLITDAATPR